MNKKGTHVEVIISFIIFIIFLVFLFVSVESPLKGNEDKKGIFDSIELGIINDTSSDMTSVTVNVGDSSETCLSLTNLLTFSNIGPNIIVKDYSGNTIQSHLNGDSLVINRASTEDTFFKIYYSEEFNELEGGSGCTETTYDVGFTKTNRYVFEEKFLGLLTQDYGTLRTELKVPQGTEFGYGIILSDGTMHETVQQNVSTNIYIRETPVEYVDGEGNILQGYVKTRIW
ncbi:MAG: hypothetical protein ACP5NZ_04570 [Nanobdellota archaeon]